MLKEENNDLRNRNNQLHETMKIKISDLQEAEKCMQYLKERSKQAFRKSTTTTPTHHNPREQMNRTKMT